MYLGLSTYTFPWHQELAKASPAPFTFVDMLQFAYDKQVNYFQFGDNYPLHLFSDRELKELKQTASDKNIRLQAGTRGLTVDNMQRYITIAQTLGSAFLRVVIDDIHYEPSAEEVIQTILTLIPSLKQAGVVLAIENHDRFRAKALVNIIEATNPEWVAICLDTANSLGAGEGIHEIAPLLLPYTINVHIKDFNIARGQHKMGFTISGAAAGEGMLNIPWLIAECKKYERCATATLELWMNREESDEDTLAKEINWINKSITFLNKYIQWPELP